MDIKRVLKIIFNKNKIKQEKRLMRNNYKFINLNAR